MSKLIQVSQIQASPDGTYINGEVRAVLSRAVEPKNPKAPWKALLADSTGVIDASFWGGSIAHWEGKQIVISGKGMKVQEYNGTKTLSVGDKTSVGFGGAPGTAAQEEQLAGDPVPVRHSSTPGAMVICGGPHRPPAAAGTPIHGATVGGCLARAVEIWIATKEPDSRWTESSLTMVEKWARQLTEVSEAMEKGAPPVNIPF